MVKNEVANLDAPDAKAVAMMGEGLGKFGQENPAGAGGGLPLLRLLRGDGFVYGAEDIPADEDSEWGVNIMSFEHGWDCWTNNDGDEKNELLGEVYVSVLQHKPAIEDLPDHGQKWKEKMRVQMTCLKGGDKGVSIEYPASSVGGLDFLKKLALDVGNKTMEDKEAGRAIKNFPVITLQFDSYQHKKWGRVYKPLYTITSWTDGVSKKAEKAKPAKKARTRTRK